MNEKQPEIVFDDYVPKPVPKQETESPPKVLNVRDVAKFVWELQRQYGVMLHEFDDPHRINESWDDASFDDQNSCIKNITELIYGGPERIDMALEQVSEHRSQKKMNAESYVTSRIYLGVIKSIISEHEITDDTYKEVGKDWLN